MPVIYFIALFLLLLVTGVFWGLWFSFSRSYQELSIPELTHIARIIIKNLAFPMRFLSMACILFMSLSAWLSHSYLIFVSIAFIVTTLLITILIEVPINNQVITWTPDTAPSNREAIINRWQFYNVIRVITALASFGFFVAAML